MPKQTDGPVSAGGYGAKGVYIGPRPDLKGKAASLTIYPSTGRCLATFDDPDTGHAIGVHDFQAEHFEIKEDEHNGRYA